MFCNQCGEENRNDRKFCSNCGAPLRDYTKPRENLIMPEDVLEAEKIQKKIKKANKIFNIILGIMLFCGIVFLLTTFFVEKDLQLAFSITSLSCLIVYIIIATIKMSYNKKHKVENETLK